MYKCFFINFIIFINNQKFDDLNQIKCNDQAIFIITNKPITATSQILSKMADKSAEKVVEKVDIAEAKVDIKVTNCYGFRHVDITKLAEIDLKTVGVTDYTYKTVDFMYRVQEDAKKLIVSFHGSLPSSKGSEMHRTSLPVFRCFDWVLQNVNVLTISNKLIEVYNNNNNNNDNHAERKLLTSWYLSTEKHDFQKIYDEIVAYIIKAQTHTNLLSFGTSDGGYPAVSYACRFGMKCVVANTQLYLEQHTQYEVFKKLVDDDKDIINSYAPIEELIATHGLPTKMVYYCNLLDTKMFVEGAIRFGTFVQKTYPEKVDMRFFISSQVPRRGHTVHDIQVPVGADLRTLCGIDGI